MPAPRKSLFSSLASTSDHAQLPQALLAWVRSLPATKHLRETFDKERQDVEFKVDDLNDLMNGIVLGQVLIDIDSNHFRPLSSAASNVRALQENWVLRFNHLKRLYKLLIRYFEDTLSSSTTELSTPNLQLVAKGDKEEGADDEVCKLAGLVLALAVQSDQRLDHIERIQGLEEWVQRELMYSIEQVMSKVRPNSDRDKGEEMDADSEFYQIQHEKSRLIHDREALQTVYEDLVEQFNQLKEDHEEAISNARAAEARAIEAENLVKTERSERAGSGIKGELERVRTELQKTENQLGETEQVVERQTKLVEDLTRKVEELTPLAAEATQLKDQMDEYKHASEKAKKMENVLDKYKKKVEEAGEWKRAIKTLEDQNSDLLDRNASLEEDYQKLSTFKPLMESYKTKLDTLEAKNSNQLREKEELKEELRTVREKLRRVEEERTREKEGVELLEERVKELELGEKGGKKSRKARENENGGAVDEEDFEDGGVGAELDDAVSGKTTTDLKLQIRRLERQLKAAQSNQADQSRIVVLENLLEDANRMKTRYEGEYLKECRDRLRAERKLEVIVNGKAKVGDGPEAAIALRQRLNETVEDLERVRKDLTDLEVRHETQQRELTIAKSDLNLVNKDQLDVLHSLRASVSVEKDAASAELERVKSDLKEAQEKAKAHQEEVNKLLLDKIDLQGEGISQREKMLEREREFGSKDRTLSDADRAKLSNLEKDNSALRDQVSEQRDKLQQMKAFIKQQDKLFKEAHAAESNGNFEEAEQTYLQQIQQLKDELDRQKVNSTELEHNYRREHELLLSAFHDTAMRHMQSNILASANGSNKPEKEYQPQSWIKQQRLRANGKGLRGT